MGQRWPLYTGPMWLAPLSRLGSISWKLRQCQIQILSPPVVWKKEREVTQSCPTLCDTMDCSLPGYSVHGIFHARVLEWVAISFSRRSSQPWDGTQVSCIVGRHFTIWATREAPPPLPRSQAYLFNLLEPICFTHPTKTHLTSDSHRSGQLGGLRAITALQSSLTQKLPTGMLSDSLCEGHRSCLSDLFLPLEFFALLLFWVAVSDWCFWKVPAGRFPHLWNLSKHHLYKSCSVLWPPCDHVFSVNPEIFVLTTLSLQTWQ